MIRRMLASTVAALGTAASLALPASAQGLSTPAPAGGPSLVYVWGWILVAGVIIFVAGTSLFSGTGNKR